MPRRDDIHKILILGSGPIVIGQAAEFDYSGVQACKVLREEGYEIVLVNSNPATIMTDPEFADATYVEPLLPGPVAQIIEKERPDALLPTLGGQTALNLAKALHEDGTLERFGVELIGADYDAIDRAEDRELFQQTMAGGRAEDAGQRDRHDARRGDRRRASELGLPAIVRPAFTLGGRGGGIARTEDEFRAIVARGLDASPIGQVLIDQSVIGWGEFELEVMRDRNDNVVIVCSIENIDPMGVHTGDSVTVAPQQTLTDRLYQKLRDQAIAVHPRRRRRDRRLQRAVRGQPDDRGDPRHRDEPARVALLGAGLEGHRLPDRQDRRAPGRRLHARGDPQRHHAGHAGELRADDRLRRRQVAALRVREVPRRRRRALDAHEVGGRGDGDRPHVRAGVREGDALARARRAAQARRARRRDAAERCSSARRRTATTSCSRRSARARRSSRSTSAASIDPWFLRELQELALDPEAPFARRALVQGGRHLRRRVRGRDAVLLLGLGAPRRAHEVRRGDNAVGRDPRRRARTASARASSSTTAACTPR